MGYCSVWLGWPIRGIVGCVRHELASVLVVAACAVLAGARSLTATAE